MFRSSILRLMRSQLYERVDKWTHESWSNFNHKKHISNTFIRTFIFSIILFRKYKNIFTFLHTHTKLKIPFPHHIYFIALLFTLLHLIFILLTFTPCAWQPLGGVGDTRQENCFVGCLKKNDETFFDCFPRVRYKSRVSSWRKFTPYTTLYT
jgi:hypothetical protein